MNEFDEIILQPFNAAWASNFGCVEDVMNLKTALGNKAEFLEAWFNLEMNGSDWISGTF
jgi:hypothetical protein